MKYSYFDLLVDVQAIILQAEKDFAAQTDEITVSYAMGKIHAAKEIKKLIEEVNK